MPLTLAISPHGRPFVEPAEILSLAERRIAGAFEAGAGRGLLDLATDDLRTAVSAEVAFVRGVGVSYFTRLCHYLNSESSEAPAIDAPMEELADAVLRAPPMKGLEYLNVDVLATWWRELDELVRGEMRAFAGGPNEYLKQKSPLWRQVGRVTFHLAENKRDPKYPFAFLATYATKLSAHGRVQQQPLGRALEEFSGARNKAALLSLLLPIRKAAESVPWVNDLVEAEDVYHPIAWSAADAYQFLRDIPALEQSGLSVRVPNWWSPERPPRAVVNVKVGEKAKGLLDADALLDFSVGVALNGERLSEAQVREILSSDAHLISIKGKWVEIDREKLKEALDHWKTVEREAKSGGVSFFEGMRLLAGAPIDGDAATKIPEEAREWTGITAGAAVEQALRMLRESKQSGDLTPPGLQASLRPYQSAGVHWLRFMSRLGLGACLADDMGLGKTIQVLAALLHAKAAGRDAASLLIVPASLIANWKAELNRFAPSISYAVEHSSERGDKIESPDLVITTYGMLSRSNSFEKRNWQTVILDEAQAIKNSGTRQARAVKALKSKSRIALTGTPVENRLSDLWSLFDFLNPGLLGSAKAFGDFVKKMSAVKENGYAPLRALARPYILRRLKTDRKIIADLPDKTETTAFCGLSKKQAVLYAQAVKELADLLSTASEGIQRKGIVLSYLMRLKQICNHPSQLAGGGVYDPSQSGKFQRLGEICGELAERQEKTLVFTQFREIATPIAEYLETVFGRPGCLLHGGTAVAKRRELVEDFQRDDGPPFFVLTVKAGGTGLNLTEASHVIHFDRWWNPAVENQATDRAFRIGQKKNVFVHKFVCQGTVEERIDEMIAHKVGLARDVLDEGAETLLTEMSDEQLLRFVSLDVSKATSEI